MLPDLSIVLAVWNSGRLLARQLDSILAQTWSNFEVICIDDGSTDSETIEILDDYAARDPRLRVVHKKNEGGLKARFDGIQSAVGRYVFICDHDDALHRQLVEYCVRTMDGSGLDLLSFRNYRQKKPDLPDSPPLGDFGKIPVTIADSELRCRDEKTYLWMISTFQIPVWTRCLSRALAQDAREPESEVGHALRVLAHAKRWAISEARLYYYNQGNESSEMRSPVSAGLIRRRHARLVRAVEEFAAERMAKSRVWDTVLYWFIVRNVKTQMNLLRRNNRHLGAAERRAAYEAFAEEIKDFFARGYLRRAKIAHRLKYWWICLRYGKERSL